MKFTCLLITILGVTLFNSCKSPRVPKSNENTLTFQPKGFSSHMMILEPRAIGESVMKSSRSLGLEIRVQVENYVPRSLAPELIIAEKRANTIYWISDTNQSSVNMSFLIEDPDLMNDGAQMMIQMLDQPDTRVKVPGKLRYKEVENLDKRRLDSLSLPSFEQWLNSGKN